MAFVGGFLAGQQVKSGVQRRKLLEEEAEYKREERGYLSTVRKRTAAKQERIQGYLGEVSITGETPLSKQKAFLGLTTEAPEQAAKLQSIVKNMGDAERVAAHAKTTDLGKVAVGLLNLSDQQLEARIPDAIALAKSMGAGEIKLEGTTAQKRFKLRQFVIQARKDADLFKPSKAPTGYREKPDGTYGIIPGGPADPAVIRKKAEAERADISRIRGEAEARRAPVKTPAELAAETEAVEEVKAKYRADKKPFAGIDAKGKPAFFKMEEGQAVEVPGAKPPPKKGQIIQVDEDGNVTITEGVEAGQVFGRTDKKSRRDLNEAQIATRKAIAGAGELKTMLQANPDAFTTAGAAVRIGQALLADAKAALRTMNVKIEAAENATAYADTFEEVGVTNARAQSLITNLAFAAAAASGQTGRSVSNRDIERFIREIGGGYADPKARTAIIDDFIARTERNYRIRHKTVMDEDFKGELGAVPAKAAPVGGQEGRTATNPKTGDKIIFKGGKWQPVK